MSAARPGRRRAPIVAGVLFVLGVYLAVDAWWSGSLLRYRLAGYSVAALLALPLATRLVFGQRLDRFWRRVVFVAVPVLVSLLLCEGLYRVLGPEYEPPARQIADVRLGHRVVPGTAGTDERGFRNPAALPRADALILGDSQTWGFRLTREQTFASLLAKDLGVDVYQMANGSYGPVQYRELLPRGLELAPELVVVAMYFGNDLIDATDYAGLDGAESVRTQGRSYTVRVSTQLRGKRSPNLTMACVDALLGTSRLIDAAARVVKSRLQGGVLDSQPGAVFFEHPTAGTVLLPDYRFVAVDPQSPSVADGVAVSGRCLRDIAARCEESQTRCVLLLIPSKEFTYAEWQGERLPELAELHAAETRVRQQVSAAARAAGLPMVDLSEALVAAMAAGRMPWFASGDGHINAVGHQIVAEVLAQEWRR